jgi:DNA-binding FadR family transcriptional regulator
MEQSASNVDQSIEPDLRFHLGILRATGNELLGPLGALIETALASSMKLTSSQQDGLSDALPLHKAVLDGIEARDPERARQAMRALLAGAIADMRRAIAGQNAAVYEPT